jgi:16S rRNA (guanine966-N2)-methyltransferase
VTRAPRPPVPAGTEREPKRAPGRLRIVGGIYRGRKLPVPDQPGVRPTADRVRETLFNWLAPIMPGARCLDCFAGSGALGLEAASRGAAEVVMLERAEPVVRQLLANVRTLGANQVQVVRGDAQRWLEGQGRPFDIVFLDPPFADSLLAPTCALLARNGWVREGSRVYLEAQARTGLPPLPQGWCLVREQRAGQVAYGLALVEPHGWVPGTGSSAGEPTPTATRHR